VRNDSAKLPLSDKEAISIAISHVKVDADPHEYDTSITREDGIIYVMFVHKRPGVGGVIKVWIDVDSGEVIKSEWYQ